MEAGRPACGCPRVPVCRGTVGCCQGHGPAGSEGASVTVGGLALSTMHGLQQEGGIGSYRFGVES